MGVGSGHGPGSRATQFKPGVPSTGGRPRIAFDLRERCRELGAKVIEGAIKDLEHKDANIRHKTRELILAYGFGRPMSSHLVAQIAPENLTPITEASTPEQAADLYQKTLAIGRAPFDDGPPIIDVVRMVEGPGLTMVDGASDADHGD